MRSVPLRHCGSVMIARKPAPSTPPRSVDRRRHRHLVDPLRLRRALRLPDDHGHPADVGERLSGNR